ncbi:DMT family transporter [Frateuria aurantia]
MPAVICAEYAHILCIFPGFQAGGDGIGSSLSGGCVSNTMKLLAILLVVLAGMGLAVEAGILGPLGAQVGHYWACLCLFGIEAALAYLLMLFWGPRQPLPFLAAPAWQLTGGIWGPLYVVILTVVTPVIGITLLMTGVLAGQVGKSLLIDHYGWLGAPRRAINGRRVVALILVAVALVLIAGGK